MPFELRDHTADVAVEATAPTLSALFSAVADGLAAASCDEIPDPDAVGAESFELAVAAGGSEALLFDYLDQLIYERDVRAVLPVAHDVRVTEPGPDADVDDDPGEDSGDADPGGDAAGRDRDRWHLAGTYRGVPLDRIDAREVKAVTYSEMRIEETETGWTAYVVFDV